MVINADYDKGADVLYLRANEDTVRYSKETKEDFGVILSFNGQDELIGCIVLDASQTNFMQPSIRNNLNPDLYLEFIKFKIKQYKGEL